MTRLSSSQQINQNTVNAAAGSRTTTGSTAAATTATTHSSGNIIQSSANSTTASTSANNYVTPVPPLSSNVIITGHNKWGIPSTKITSGGVTVTTSQTPRVRPYSQGPTTLMGSTGALGAGKLSGNALNQSTGSIGLQQVSSGGGALQPPAATTLLHQALQSQPSQSYQSPLQQNSISVHHASPASPTFQTNQKSVMTLPVNSSSASVSQSAAAAAAGSSSGSNHEVIVSGPMTVTSRRNNDNTSVTLLNANSSIINQRMSTFEPYQIMRDTVQQFCEKHFSSIKVYMDKLSHRLPPPTRCGIEGNEFT